MNDWTISEIAELRALYLKFTASRCAKKLGRSLFSVKGAVQRFELKHGPDFKRTVDDARQLTTEEKKFIADHYLTLPLPVLIKKLNRSKSAIMQAARAAGIQPGVKVNTGRIQPGYVSPLKGKKMAFISDAFRATMFKPGVPSANKKEVGTIALRTSKHKPYTSYYWIKIGEPNKWEQLHRHIWKLSVGEIPPEFNIQFKDKNQMNCKPENLYMINRKSQMIENSIMRYTPEIRSLIRLTGKLKRKIKSYAKQD